MPPLGAKLEMLITAGCIDRTEAALLPAAQQAKIEELSNTEIGRLLDVYNKVGPVSTARII